jgi:hypothetical protein
VPTSCDAFQKLYTCSKTRNEVQFELFKDKTKTKELGESFKLMYSNVKFYLNPGTEESI